VPVTPPRTIGERFDPMYLTDENPDDLVSFTGLDRDACLDSIGRESENVESLVRALGPVARVRAHPKKI
jgi:hypothetical protein